MPVILFTCLAVILGCAITLTDRDASSQIRKVNLNENFRIQPGETVQAENGKLKIRLKGVGRTISESGETEYVELQIQLNKSEQIVVISERGNPAKAVGSYVIKLINAESFGKTSCELKIFRKS